MILRKTQTVNLQRPSRKILQLSTSYADTAVFLEVKEPGESETIVHIDYKGKILWEFTLEDTINQFCMVSDREVAILDIPKQKVVLLNLQTKTISTIDHHFLFDQTAQMEIQTFALTKYLTVVEKGNSKDERLAITYYLQVKGKHKIVTKYQSKPNEYRYASEVTKANSHSMYIWYSSLQFTELILFLFDLRSSYKGELRQIKIGFNLLSEIQVENAWKWTVFAVWEADIHNLMILALYTSNNRSAVHRDVEFKSIIYSTDKDQIRLSNLTFPDGWGEKVMISKNIGTYSVFYTYGFDRGTLIESPIFVVSNLQQKIIQQQSWKLTPHRHIHMPSYCENLLIEADFKENDVKQLIIQQTKIWANKDIMVHFLLHINEDFDDDLLKDAIDLLEQG